MTVATEVDHILPINAGGDARKSANLQSLCSDCHKSKTRAERAGLLWIPPKYRGCDVNGAPRANPWYPLD